MKCTQAESYILLQQSSELGSWNRLRLATHLRHCPACRQFKDHAAWLTQSMHSVEPVIPTPAATLEQIQVEAARHRSRTSKRRDKSFLHVWQPALVYVTLLILLLGGWFALSQRFTSTPQPLEITWDDHMEEDLSAFTETLFYTADEFQNSDISYDDQYEAVDDMARELLAMKESS